MNINNDISTCTAHETEGMMNSIKQMWSGYEDAEHFTYNPKHPLNTLSAKFDINSSTQLD